MFIFYRLFHRCVNSTPSGSSGSSSPTPPESSIPSPSSDPRKDCAVIVWFTVFGLSLLFRPAAELVIRVLFFAACVLLIAAADGSLNLLVGHAVLRAAKYKGYDAPMLLSLAAGSLGGIAVIWPTTLATVCIIAISGGLRLQRTLSTHITFFLELASVIAASAAACSLGVVIVLCMKPGNGPPLDPTHAARAGALGACIVTVPIISTAAFFMHEAQTTLSVRNEPMNPHLCVADHLDYPVSHTAPSPRTRPHRRRIIAHAGAEMAGYVLVTLCILTVRLLCF